MSDQGYSSLSEGCSKWPCKREPLVERDGYWHCSKCDGSYGAVQPASVAEPASAAPHRLDSWATECSEPATGADHLPATPRIELGDRFMEILRAIHSEVPDTFADSARLAFVHALKERAPASAADVPIDMILHCPACGMQHIDAPKSCTLHDCHLYGKCFAEYHGKPDRCDRWTNPPHRSHLCHGCGHIWRPADVPTNGVAAIKTKGKADSPSGAVPRLCGGMVAVPCAVQRDPSHPQYGWLFIPHADGQWVSAAKLADFSQRILDYWLAAASPSIK